MHIDAKKGDIPQTAPVLPSTFTTIVNIHVPQTKEETSSSTCDNPSPPSYASSETLLPSIYPPKGFSFNVVVASLCICGFVSALDTIVLASTLPAIATDLQAATVDAYWCSSAYLFSQSVVQLVFASFAQAFDRRVCMLAALAIFTVASVLCATARDVQWLIAGRAIQGIGAGGINTLIQLILTDIAPIAERPKYTGIITLTAAIGLVSGSLLGAVIVQNATWRIIWWINLPLCIPPLLGFAFCLKIPKKDGAETLSWGQVMRRMDWGGLVLVTASLGGILFALNSGNTVYPWASTPILVPLVCGCAGLVVFAVYEGKVAKSRALLPSQLFSNLTAVSGYLMTIIHSMLVWTITCYFFLYLNICAAHSYLESAIIMLATTISFPVAAGIAGYVIGRTMRYKAINIVSFVLILSGLGGFITLREDTSIAVQVVLLFVAGLGAGMTFISKVFMVQAAVAERDVLMATAVVATATSVGSCFGVAVAGSVFQNTWESLVEQQQANLSVVIGSQDAERSGEIIAMLDAGTATVYRHIAALSFERLWIVMVACAGVAFVLVSVTRDLKLRAS